MNVSGTNRKEALMTYAKIPVIDNNSIETIEELESKIAPEGGIAALD